jgi:hypothetical protein
MLRELTEANTALSARELQLAQDAAAVQDELRAVSTVSEKDLAQTENGASG